MCPWTAITSRCELLNLRFPGAAQQKRVYALMALHRIRGTKISTLALQRQRHIGENLVRLRLRLGLVFLVEILDRAFAQIGKRQDHDADEAGRPVRRLSEDRIRPALVPRATGTV